MLIKLDYTVNSTLLQEAASSIPSSENSYVINRPTGRFFYDPWEISDDYKNTVWDKILATLPSPKGEARIIVLPPTNSYNIHADIDDRYHLNVSGENCYLIDFENSQLHKLVQDGNWYEMDAGRLHSASNFGRYYRIQLVVRKLLTDAVLVDPVSIRLTSSGLAKEDARFIFDNTISPWLNSANKISTIRNFKFSTNEVTCDIERFQLNELSTILDSHFLLEEV
jgi:hypothetical protein